MANGEHLDILKQGVDVWNQWRKDNLDTIPNLQGADLMGANLMGANLPKADLVQTNLRGVNLQGAYLTEADFLGADLMEANLMEAWLRGADLMFANLQGANLPKADLVQTNLRGVNLRGANLQQAALQGANLLNADLQQANLQGAYLVATNLMEANFQGANLQDADLSYSSLIKTVLDKADLSGCRIYGISAWDISLEETIQSDLVITDVGQPKITVDNLEVAQFIYLLINNEKIRHVIDTITSKVVLILGRFTPKRKAVLDTMREELRKHGYLPVMFDFDPLVSRDTTETITTLARLSRFIVADITSPKSIPQELVSIVEALPSLPVQPLLKKGNKPWGMYDHIKRYPWVLEIHSYKDSNDLLISFQEKVILPAEAKSKELRLITKT